MQHEEAGHIAAIGVEIEPLIGLVAASARAFGDDAEIAHVTQKIANPALRPRRAEMLAHAPIDEPQLVLGIALVGKAAKKLQAAAILEPVARLLEAARDRQQREILARQRLERLAALARRCKSALDLGDFVLGP